MSKSGPVVHCEGEASTSQILRWTCVMKFHRGERLANHDNRTARRALDRIAIRVGRARTIGRPIVWRLRSASPAVPKQHSNREQLSNVNGLAGRSR
jgi:hypothetical protein